LWRLTTPVIPTRPIGTPSTTIHRPSFTNGESVTKAWIISPSRRTPRSPEIQLQFPPAPSPCLTYPRRARVRPPPRQRLRTTSADDTTPPPPLHKVFECVAR